MTVKKVGTKTTIAVALALLAAGPVVAAWYHYGFKIKKLTSFPKESASVSVKENNSAGAVESPASIQAGTVLGTCQVCGEKTYCKCECPSKK